MKKLLHFLKENYETLLFAAAVLLLALALFKPQIKLDQQVHNYFLLADVSQSMNAEDLKLDNKTVSRMAYTRYLMKKVVETSPCGTYISVGVFAAENVALLFMPLEVCSNYDVITDSIDQLEWRMSWKGNSRLSFGVKSATRVLDSLSAPAQMFFFTDGDEAPKVNAINKVDLSGLQGGENVILVGIGGHKPVPIPRYNADNKWVGFWSTDSKDIDAGATGATYSDTSRDEPDPQVAYAEYDRYQSQLDDTYLKGLAAEIHGKYIEGLDSPAFYQFVHEQKPVASFVTDYSISWLYLSCAGLLILLTYLPNVMFRWRREPASAHHS